MLKRNISVLMIAILLTMMAIPAAAQTPTRAAAPSGNLIVAVTGSIADAPAAGTFTIKRFVKLGDGLGAEGVLSLTNTAGSVATAVTVPVAATTASASSAAGPSIQQVGECEILDLTLGPLDLNLAGLEVHLDVVHLLISADPTGGLLGSLLAGLLCGSGGSLLAGLLQNLAGNLQQVINILNQILSILG
jgi:hypothetical protein